MKLIILALWFLSACSSTHDRPVSKAPEKVTNDDFKKEKVLTANEFTDSYAGDAVSVTPALQDETLDRLSDKELSSLNTSADPLMEISVRCNQRDFKGAFQLASKNFNKYQKIAPYWNLIANCHLNQGSFRKALLFYNKALEVKPNYVPALNNIGVLYSRQGQDQKALVAFERANRVSKFSKTPRYNLAKLYLTYGLSELALPLFQGLLSDAPTDADLLNAVASCYFLMSDYNRAFAHYSKIPQTEWERAEIGLNFAVTLSKLNKKKEAAQVFAQVEKPISSALKRYYTVVESKLGDAE